LLVAGNWQPLKTRQPRVLLASVQIELLNTNIPARRDVKVGCAAHNRINGLKITIRGLKNAAAAAETCTRKLKKQRSM